MIVKKLLLCAVFAAGTILIISSCKDMGDQVTQQPPPAGGLLTAIPPSVTVGQGASANVSIRGGSAPYVIAIPPNSALASASILDSTLTITGVSVASVAGSTSVKVRDSSPSPQKEVTVPITKVP